MKEDEIKVAVAAVLEEVQTLSGRAYVDLGGDDRPIDSLDGFDSVIAVEATDMLEKKLGCRIRRETVFVSKDGTRASTINEICSEVESEVAARDAA